jgi:hypothetical protein
VAVFRTDVEGRFRARDKACFSKKTDKSGIEQGHEDAIGPIDTQGLVGVIEVADVRCKAANVDVVSKGSADCGFDFSDGGSRQGRIPLEKPESIVAQQIARAAAAFVCQRTGHVPAAVELAQSSEMLAITLHNARALPGQGQFRQSEGTTKLHEVYRTLFTESSDWLRQEVGRITGSQMGTVTVADKAPTGTVVVLMTGSEPNAASQQAQGS